MIELDDPIYPLSVAAKVWGLSTPTARLYVNEYLLLSKPGQGVGVLLTARRILQGAIGSELSSSFRTAALPCKAALNFTDFAAPDEAPGFMRDAGRLYDGARTALIAYPNGEGVVIRVDSKTPLQQIFSPIGGAGIELGRQPRGSFLLLDFIVKRVEQLLAMYESGAVI